MATRMSDRERVEQLQQRLSQWNPDEKCQVHSWGKCAVYDAQGRLVELHLCEQGLSQIPSEVWQCSALQRLFLSDNQLSALPPELGALSFLQHLYLYNNQLRALPPELGALSFLQHLYLYNNQLSALPPELGALSSLLSLDLDNNQLSALPPELGSLSSLRDLYLDGNTWQIPPSQVIERGIAAILGYLRRAALEAYLVSRPLRSSAQEGPVRVVYLYAQEDEGFRKELERHVSGLRLQGLLADQHGGLVPVGEDRELTARGYLERAEVVLLLVSSDFMGSEDMREIQRVMERHARGEIRAMPILLRPVDWTGVPFASLAHLPSTGEPITRWVNRDDALLDVVQGLRRVVQEVLSARFEGVQRKLEGVDKEIDGLGYNYLKVKGSLRRLAVKEEALEEERRTIEEEIAVLQRRLQGIGPQVAAILEERRGFEGVREGLEDVAVGVGEEERRLEQEAEALRGLIERVKHP
jgi:Leucine rich repeat